MRGSGSCVDAAGPGHAHLCCLEEIPVLHRLVASEDWPRLQLLRILLLLPPASVILEQSDLELTASDLQLLPQQLDVHYFLLQLPSIPPMTSSDYWLCSPSSPSDNS